MRDWSMSNFLDRLGARHTDVPAIRPRAISRFESPVAAAYVDHTAPNATAPNATAHDTTAHDAILSVSVNNAPRHDLQQRVLPPSDAVGAQADAWRTRVVTRSPAAEVTDLDAHARLGTVRPRADAADRALAPASSASTSPVTVTSEPRPNTVSPGRGTLSATPIAPTLSATPIAPTRSATPIAPTLSGARVDGAVVAQRSRTQMPPATGDALAQMGAPVSREPDVIRVHIGRVEVRAILPAARPMPRQSPSTNESRPMTLDRYLGRTDRT